VTAPDDQDPTNDIYEYTIAFHLRIMGDANDDGIVNVGDLSILGMNWFKDQTITPPYPDDYCNFTREGGDLTVNVGDLALLGGNWFKTS